MLNSDMSSARDSIAFISMPQNKQTSTDDNQRGQQNYGASNNPSFHAVLVCR
jgi:hypothetical protein